ncbi:hypothetical protein ACQ4PT_015428 [Festuca glaucescens]
MPFAGMTVPCSILLLVILISASPPCHGDGVPTHNITDILAASFSAALVAANLTGKIDERQTITVLAVDNAAMGRLRERQLKPDNVRYVLSLHVLLDYFGDAKLKALNGTSPTQAASLFQASGAAPGADGIVNIAPVAAAGDGRRGVAFSAADTGGRVVFYEKSVKESPYDIAVLQVSGAMESPAAEGKAPASSPTPSPAPVAASVVAPSPKNQTAPPPKPAVAPSPKNQTAPPPKPTGAPSSPKNQTAPPPKTAGEPTDSPTMPAGAPEADDQPPADENGGHKNDAGGTAAPWSVGAVLAAAMPAVVFLLW